MVVLYTTFKENWRQEDILTTSRPVNLVYLNVSYPVYRPTYLLSLSLDLYLLFFWCPFTATKFFVVVTLPPNSRFYPYPYNSSCYTYNRQSFVQMVSPSTNITYTTFFYSNVFFFLFNSWFLFLFCFVSIHNLYILYIPYYFIWTLDLFYH